MSSAIATTGNLSTIIDQERGPTYIRMDALTMGVGRNLFLAIQTPITQSLMDLVLRTSRQLMIIWPHLRMLRVKHGY